MTQEEATITTSDEASQSETEASGQALDAAASEESATSGEQEATPASGEKPKSLAEVVQQAMNKDKAEATPAKEEKSGESDDEPEGKQDVPPKVEKKEATKDEALSKRTQDRIHELTRERDGYKADRATLQEIKELAGDEQGFNNLKVLLRDIRDNPAQSVAMLENLLADAKDRAGMVVKSTDIKQRLDDGKIDEETALELERSRAGSESAKRREQAERQAQSERLQRSMVGALDQWEQNVMGRMPDYESVREVVKNDFIASITAKPPTTEQEAVAMAQASLDKVTAWLQKKIPKAASRVATSSGASTKSSQRDKSIHDLVRRLTT